MTFVWFFFCHLTNFLMFVVLWSQWMNRVGIAWLLFYTRPYFFWCAFMLQPLEAVNNYECWTPWFYYDFSDISNKLLWFYGFFMAIFLHVWCRKYLRDVDRTQLSQLAFIFCLDALEQKTKDRSSSLSASETGSDEDNKLYRLLLTYQVRQYTAKMQPAHSLRADDLLMSAYCAYIDVEVIGFYVCFKSHDVDIRCLMAILPRRSKYVSMILWHSLLDVIYAF